MSFELTVAVVMGGLSAEREVSLETGACVTEQLARRHSVLRAEILADGSWVFPDLSADAYALCAALEILREKKVDVVFNALHGPWGEDGTIQGLFDYAGIPLTGPDVVSAAVTIDKCHTKAALINAGIATPRFVQWPSLLESARVGAADRNWSERNLERGEGDSVFDALASRLPPPWFVKPRRLGSSVGCACIEDRQGFIEWLEADLASGSLRPADYFFEELIGGRELTCAVVLPGAVLPGAVLPGAVLPRAANESAGESEASLRALSPIEIRPRSSEFFDYEAKYTPGASEEICPAPVEPDVDRALRECAVAVHRLFDCGPLSRTDFFLTDEGSLQVLEVNTLPGMTATSLVPKSAAQDGLSLEDLFDGLLRHAIARHERKGIRQQARVENP